MTPIATSYSVFTKFWNLPLEELARTLSNTGVDGAELPVRDGYPVTMENIGSMLPEAAKIFADHGQRIFSIAPPIGPLSQSLIETCAKAGVVYLRVMIKVGGEGYLKAEEDACRHYESLIPWLEDTGMKIGVQNHADYFVANAAGLRRVVERFDARHVAAVYDVGHCGLDGEIPEIAVDLLHSHLLTVNLKNMVWEETKHTDGNFARWKRPVVAGRKGLMPWPDVAAALRKRNWSGMVNICSEYSDLTHKNELLADDIAFAREYFG